MKKRNKGLGFHGCNGCQVELPEKECVSCCVPRRENLPRQSCLVKKVAEPLIIGWGTVD